MKKILCTLFVIIIMATYAAADEIPEIRFLGNAWLSNDQNVLQTLIEKGILYNQCRLTLSHDNYTYLCVYDTGLIVPDYVPGTEEVTYTATLNDTVKGTIAGYPLKNLTFTFAYDGEYKLIAVNVELINATYDDLKNKLIKVYGEEETIKTEEGIWSTVWKGSNSSAIMLYTQSEGLDYILMYGRLDAAEILSQCLSTADPDDFSGL